MKVAVISFGGQYNHLIWRAVRGLAEAKLLPMSSPLEVLKDYDCMILGGGPYELPRDAERLSRVKDFLELRIPTLGICLGHQLMAYFMGGEIGPSAKPEYGDTWIYVDDEDQILKGLKPKFLAWESHNTEVIKEPPNSRVIAHSDNTRVQALVYQGLPFYSVQFHPEVQHTEKGIVVFKNFLEVCRR